MKGKALLRLLLRNSHFSSPDSYSGSDIAIIVRDALMQPVRKVLGSTHFKPVRVNGKLMWTPCSPGDPEAVEKSWTEVESDELLEPALRMKDFEQALSNARPTVSADDIKKHDQWTNDAGECGRLHCARAL